jgi:hypothetical protein
VRDPVAEATRGAASPSATPLIGPGHDGVTAASSRDVLSRKRPPRS